MDGNPGIFRSSRKKGPDVYEFTWAERLEDGTTKQRWTMVGPTFQETVLAQAKQLDAEAKKRDVLDAEPAAA